jgi:hypothetical protein
LPQELTHSLTVPYFPLRGNGCRSISSLPTHNSGEIWKKAIVTIGVLAVCLSARKIPLPVVAAHVDLDHKAGTYYSIMALGVYPLLAAYVLVEIAALLVPGWRPLRTGPPAARAQLHRASLIIGLLLALGQGFVMALALEKEAASGASARLITVCILLGATAALVILARIVDGNGLGSGFAILILAGALLQIFVPIGNALAVVQADNVRSLITGAFGVALLVGATLWMFSPYRLPTDEELPHPALLSRPGCGLAPLSIIPLGLTLITKLGSGLRPPSDLLPTLVLGVIAAILFAILFNRQERVTAFWKALAPNPVEGIPNTKVVIMEGVLFTVLAVLVQFCLVQRLGVRGAPNVAAVILATGVISDLARDWRAYERDPSLIPVWEIHQLYAVEPAMRLLKDKGIAAYAQALRARSLLQFFGPYVPVRILVPASEAASAYSLLQNHWPAPGTVTPL